MKLKVRCRNGNTVERFYDHVTRSSVTVVKDVDGNQVGGADYSGNAVSANCAREQMIKDNGGEIERVTRVGSGRINRRWSKAWDRGENV
jgi:hypothetical protein